MEVYRNNQLSNTRNAYIVITRFIELIGSQWHRDVKTDRSGPQLQKYKYIVYRIYR